MMDDYAVRAHCSYNLADALEDLGAIDEMVRPNVEIDEEEFRVRMAHLYWHLNSVWNSRNLSSEELDAADHGRLNELGQFPKDLEPI
jgi:hypothetical protein